MRRHAAEIDVDDKPSKYVTLGIPEYWRFDHTGNFHGTRIAGDRLVDGRYEPIAVEDLADGVLQGYSAALNLFIRWEQGRLAWHDPATGRHILTYDDQRARADSARIASIKRERPASKPKPAPIARRRVSASRKRRTSGCAAGERSANRNGADCETAYYITPGVITIGPAGPPGLQAVPVGRRGQSTAAGWRWLHSEHPGPRRPAHR